MGKSNIAVIGYSLRAPGAHDVDAFWEILSKGRDVVTRAASNVGATATDRVHAYGVLEGFDQFDEQFFNYSPREAEDIDPQQRLLLHCAVEALESAGVRPKSVSHEIGVWVSTGLSGYLLETRDRDRSGLDATSQLMGGDGHYAATRIAYKLGLTGPAIAVGSACSSSLLAVHSAAQAILAGECDLALAGGMDVEYPQPMSYLYQSGGILSPDGVCRPFDSDANGTVFGSGGGMVLLADLETAISEDWPILAVLAGTAVNNDGANKASFSAPRPARQADVIAQALAVAELQPENVGYIECHGTGTLLGDQSELEALASVFGDSSDIVLGSAKANFGHLRVGAGVLGFIKACESFVRGDFAPTANLRSTVRAVEEHGFRVENTVTPIDPDSPKAIGVSSFGFGGTNVHAVLLPGPKKPTADLPITTETPVVLQVSATSPDACISNGIALADNIEANNETDIASISHTLKGRDDKPYRLAAIASDLSSAVRGLHADPAVSIEGWAAERLSTAILFSGQGSNIKRLAQGLWNWEPVFTKRLAELLMFAGVERSSLEQLIAGEYQLTLGQEHAFQVAVQIAIVEQLRARGLKEVHTAGYSLGEYAAAVVAGAIDAKTVIETLVARGRLLDQSPRGNMLMVAASPEAIKLVAPRIFTAGRLSESRTLIVCTPNSLEEVSNRLTEAGMAFRAVDIDLGYHSPLLKETADQFCDLSQSAEPRFDTSWIPTLLNSDSFDRPYWARHLDSTIDFRKVGQALEQHAAKERLIAIDFSDDGFLSRLATGSATLRDTVQIRINNPNTDARHTYMRALAQLWAAGCELDTAAPNQARTLVKLPARRWDLSSHLKKSAKSDSERLNVKKGHRKVQREASIENWVYQPSWSLKMRSPNSRDIKGQRWLLFTRNNEMCETLKSRLECAGVKYDCLPLEEFSFVNDTEIKNSVARLNVDTTPIDRIVHLWCSEHLDDPINLEARLSLLDTELEHGFYSLLFALQQITEGQNAHPLQVDIVAKGIHPLNSADAIPERALLLGPSVVLPQDYPFVTGRSIDISDLDNDQLGNELIKELCIEQIDHAVVLQGTNRWVRTYERDELPHLPDNGMPRRLRENGVYLITGGLGGIGMTLAEFLVKRCKARLVLTGLESIPDDEASDDPLITKRREQIKRLEELGGEVLPVRCDAASPQDTAQLMEEIDRRFGTLNGVIHAAGVFETQRAFRSIAETGREDCVRRLLPKVQGTLVLAEYLKGRDLDFVITQSSLSSQLGGLGFYAYTAGNAFMDAFTERHRNDSTPWMTVNWDGWIFRERSDDAPQQSVVSPSFASPDFGVVAEIAVRPSEGAEIYGRLMNFENPRQILISTADFNARISQWVNSHHQEKTDASLIDIDSWKDPVARKVADAWSEILGVEELNYEANFFAVGGDSLLGVSLAHRLSLEFNILLNAITLFENATIEQMVAVIKEALLATKEEIVQ